MKKIKSITAVALCCLIMLASLQAAASAYSPAEFNYGEDNTNFLALGDSIAEGYGVANSAEASYGRIVADTNRYNYKNLARVAKTTDELLNEITDDNYTRESVEWADIINISIGSNNYFANNLVVPMAVLTLMGMGNIWLNNIEDEIYEDYLKIVEGIRQLNPDAMIIINNVYCSWSGVGYIPFRRATDHVNNALNNAHKELADDFIVFDTAAVLNGHSEYIAEDSTHPNSAGNVVLARELLSLLKTLGLGENTEPIILSPGEDYNYFVKYYGEFPGYLIWIAVKVLTFHF